MRPAFPFGAVPRYVIRERDSICGEQVVAACLRLPRCRPSCPSPHMFPPNPSRPHADAASATVVGLRRAGQIGAILCRIGVLGATGEWYVAPV